MRSGDRNKDTVQLVYDILLLPTFMQVQFNLGQPHMSNRQTCAFHFCDLKDCQWVKTIPSADRYTEEELLPVKMK